VRRASWSEVECPIARALDVVGDPWTLLVVRDAQFGVRRFEDFQRSSGIPRATLVDRLDRLVDHGVLERCRYQDHPPRDEYRLTDRGRDLRDVLVVLKQWGDRWGGLPSSPIRLERTDTGEELEPVLADRRSGRFLDDLPVRAVRRDGTPAASATANQATRTRRQPPSSDDLD
jgi:DNA-binding HxlR family transcriptional regulator